MPAMLDYARRVLEHGGQRVIETRELPTGYGWKLLCEGGGAVCVYRTGKFVAEGKPAPVIKRLFAAAPPPPKSASSKPKVAAPRPAAGETDGEFVSRRSANWSDTWARGDIPF